jgi:hypothetical protein
MSATPPSIDHRHSCCSDDNSFGFNPLQPMNLLTRIGIWQFQEAVRKETERTEFNAFKRVSVRRSFFLHYHVPHYLLYLSFSSQPNNHHTTSPTAPSPKMLHVLLGVTVPISLAVSFNLAWDTLPPRRMPSSFYHTQNH